VGGDFISHFKSLRLATGLSQAAVANELGITQGAVHQWEKGETHPQTKLLSRIAALYGCTVDELLQPEVNETQ